MSFPADRGCGRKCAAAGLLAVVSLLTGACSSNSSTPSQASPNPINVTGTWTGSASDSSGPGQMTWQLTQSGSSFSGTLTMTESTKNLTGRGSVSGTVSGSSLQFAIAVPVGGFDGDFTGCSTNVSGNATGTATSISGTYSGTSSCGGGPAISSGTLTLTKQ